MVKKIVVFGATGAQGGGVAAALLKNSAYKVKAVTRNVKSAKAKALEKQGAKLEKGDLDDPKSLAKLLKGCYGVFGVTFWEMSDPDKEIQQGKNLIEACKAAGVKHLIFSGLESVNEAVGKPCSYFETKAEIEKHLSESEVPYTIVRYAGYYENIQGFLKDSIRKEEEDSDTFVLNIPLEGIPMAMISAPGAGKAVAAIFDSPDDYIGRTIGLASDDMPIQEYADILSKHLEPKTFKAGEITAEEFGQLGFPGAEDMAAMFEFLQSRKGIFDVPFTKYLDPTIIQFEDWVIANKDALDEQFK